MAVSDANQSDVGIIGLDVMGRNVALHLAEQGFHVAAYDGGRSKSRTLREQTDGPKVRVAANISELVAKLHPPRTILIFGGAEDPLHLVLNQLLPELRFGDLVMDAGDSDFRDTAKYQGRLAERGVQFMGIGLAGGESGARHGAVVMAGGGREARDRTRPLLEAMAATVQGEPCVSFFKTAAAAHYVKMCHAGIEYSLLQLLSETFSLLQCMLLLTDEELQDVTGAWRLNVLNGYLMELSGRVGEATETPMPRVWLEERLESARNGPLAEWLLQCAREFKVPIPTIETALEAQHAGAKERRQALLAAPFRQPVGRFRDDPEGVMDELHGALQAAMMITYAQGMGLLSAASQHLDFEFNLHEIPRAWRGCARLRTPLLEGITTAWQTTPELPGLLADDDFSEGIMARQESLRHAVWRANDLDADVPALLASLDYLDARREAWLPMNLIQVPRAAPARAPVPTEWAYEEFA